jgi:hypothetical protein
MERTDTTFGTTVSALILADLVKKYANEYHTSKKVSRTLTKFNSLAQFLEQQIDMESADVCYKLLVDDYIKRCNVILADLPDAKINTFTQNVIKTRYRRWINTKKWIQTQKIQNKQ